MPVNKKISDLSAAVSVNLTDEVEVLQSGDNVRATVTMLQDAVIAPHSVAVGDLAQLAARSVLGNSTASTADVAAITAAADDRILARTSGTLAFQQLTVGMFPASVVTYAKIQDVTDNRLLGRSAGSTGVMQEITVGTGLSLSAGSLTNSGVTSLASSGSTITVSASTGAVDVSLNLAHSNTWSVQQNVINGSFSAQFGKTSTYAGQFSDATRTVKFADGTYAINVTAGLANVPGTSGNTYRWNAGTTAPSTNAGTPTTRYGGNTNYLGDPDVWVLVNVGGTDYKFGGYLP